MRVHGNVTITRRNNTESKTDYHDYLNDISDDFGHICGYCGKREVITTKGFEIDHFVPKSIDPERETDYSNLVYSCFTCNRKKSKKWPTQDKNTTHNGLVGFIDPASQEYDLHLHREKDGMIEGLTEIGKYMCLQVFKFSVRPIKELWVCSEILAKQEIIESKISNLSLEDKEDYINLNIQLKELRQCLFSKRE
jgi:uncharacterized protein (TIGR02646 family)